MKLIVTVWGSLLVLALATGCRGGDGEGIDSLQEIPDALTAFSEAFVNNDVDALGESWSETCDPRDIVDAEAASRVLSEIFPGEYHLSVGSSLVIEVDDDHVKVPLEQPEGAIAATLVVGGQEAPVLDPLPFNASLEFVLEDGDWKVQNCGGLFED